MQQKFATIRVAALATLALALWDGGLTSAQEAPPAPAVTTAPVVKKAITSETDYVGSVEAINSVDLMARVEGFLEKRAFEEGASVKQGDPLYQIEKAQYTAAVENSQGALDSAQAVLKNATINRQRYETLVQKQDAPQANLDDAISKEDQARGDVESAKADLAQAKLDLSYTDISAPFDGRVGRSNYAVGALVGPSSSTLATLVQLDPIYVHFNIADRDLLEDGSGLKSGDFVPKLRLADGSTYEHDGKIAFISPEFDQSTDTAEVRATFANPDGKLLPNQFVTLMLESKDPTETLVVPQMAVQQDQTGFFVLTVDKDDTVKIARFSAGAQTGTDWIVESGLTEGEQVIVDGLEKVRPGIKVNASTQSANQETSDNAQTGS